MRLQIVPDTLFKKGTNPYARYICVCGTSKVIRCTHVNSGKIASCGCLRRETSRIINTTHGGRHTRLYTTWYDMKKRCYNPNNSRYSSYGARGITICDSWRNDFASFRAWAYASGYKDTLTIDRIDNDGNYEPSNCQWLTRSENSMKSNKERRNNG